VNPIGRRPVLLSTLALSLAACSQEESEPAAAAQESTGSTQGAWPRTITHAAGETVVESAPTRIVSTSVTLTGSMLAAGVPVVGSGTAAISELSDANGWFSQWADVAVEQGIDPLYSLDVDLEAVAAAAPDLIIGSAKGGDSSAEVYEQLSALAPTILLRYDDQTWQEVTTEIGAATGHEDGARAAIDEFAAKLDGASATMTAPDGDVAALVFNGLSQTSRFWTPESAQGALLADAGFSLLQVPTELGSVQDGRADVVDVTVENLATVLADASAIVLFSADESTVAEFVAAPTLSSLPAVASDSVVAAGLDSFRLDAYSASNVLDRLVTSFS